MKKILVVNCVLIIMLICAGTMPAIAATLWYNGDFQGGFVENENNAFSTSYIYDDFTVPSGGWTINTVWSNNMMFLNDTVTQASWEIRSGVSANNGGTVVASGTGSATQIATGRSSNGLVEYTIQVTGLNVILGPGTYWLNVAPKGSANKAFMSGTTGANAIGQPPGDDDNSFFTTSLLPYYFQPTSAIPFSIPQDFSMGVGNNTVPVPPSLLLLGSGLLGLGALRRFRKS
jgi:hypothetical protein